MPKIAVQSCKTNYNLLYLEVAEVALEDGAGGVRGVDLVELANVRVDGVVLEHLPTNATSLLGLQVDGLSVRRPDVSGLHDLLANGALELGRALGGLVVLLVPVDAVVVDLGKGVAVRGAFGTRPLLGLLVVLGAVDLVVFWLWFPGLVPLQNRKKNFIKVRWSNISYWYHQ